MPAAGGIGDGGTRHRGAAVGGGLGGGQVPALGQVVDVVAGPGGAGPVLAVAGGRAQDDPRIDGTEILEPDAQPIDHPRPEALDHDVRRPHQGQERLAALFDLEVDGRA